METDFAVPAPVRQGLIKPDIPTPDDKTANLLGISGFTSSSGSIQATPDNTSGLDMLKSGSSRSKPVPWVGSEILKALPDIDATERL